MSDGDLEFMEEAWDRKKIRALVDGGWYRARAAALDGGDPSLLLEVIQLERDIGMIPDVQQQQAVILAMHGVDPWDIGSAMHSPRAGRALISRGITALTAIQEQRAVMSDRVADIRACPHPGWEDAESPDDAKVSWWSARVKCARCGASEVEVAKLRGDG